MYCIFNETELNMFIIYDCVGPTAVNFDKCFDFQNLKVEFLTGCSGGINW
jgi:hypothetical protein